MAMSSPFDSYVITAGSNGSLVIPMIDTSSAGMPCVKIGPYFTKNPMRMSIILPDREDAYSLPAPVRADRKAIRFQPVLIYFDMPLPPQTTFHFDRIYSVEERGKVKKTPAHTWEPHERTSIYPSLPIQVSPVLPGERIHFDGWSYFVRKRKMTVKNIGSIPMTDFDPPEMTRFVNMRIMCLVEAIWPTMDRPRKTKVNVIKGDPVAWSLGQSPDPKPQMPDIRVKEPMMYQMPDPNEEEPKLEGPRRPWYQFDDEEDEGL